MNIVCVGGGPAGLYAALLLARHHEVTVVERNAPGESAGWGVVFSDQTLGRLLEADAPGAEAIFDAFHHWDAIDVHVKERVVRSHGHGFCGIGRDRLLQILQQRCRDAGVRLVFGQPDTDDQALAAQYGAHLVLGADGIHSRIRARYAATYAPVIEQRDCRFAWLGTTRPFDAFTFLFADTEHGWFQAHAYQYDGSMSTFIVEAPRAAWQRGSTGWRRRRRWRSARSCSRTTWRAIRCCTNPWRLAARRARYLPRSTASPARTGCIGSVMKHAPPAARSRWC
jgi:anthraniloyl-CoA monooxygenase